MSSEEIDRASAMRLIQARRMSKRAAAEQLGITERQLYRLYDRWLLAFLFLVLWRLRFRSAGLLKNREN